MIQSVVVFDDILQGREPAVVVKPALSVAPQSGKRSSAVHMGRRAVGLERIHTDLAWSMEVISGLGEKWWHMAHRTFSLAIEDFFAPRGRRLVEASVGRLWHRDSQLIEVKRG